MSAFANVVAGLGLFFVGVWFLTENLKSFAGRRFRQSVVAWTKKPISGLGLGMIMGGVAQSMAVTIFILVSLLTAGLITVRIAMPVLVGANFGTSILVFLTTLNIKVVMLFVIGVSGIMMVSDRFIKLKAHLGALFGVGLLFLGISMLQQGAHTVVDQPWATELLESFQHSYFLTFIIGCVLTLVAQSASATSILVIALAGVGVFGVEQSLMAIYGANFGSGLVSFLLSSKLRGTSRQIAMYQILVLNFLGTLLFVAFFYIELSTGVPLIKALVTSIANGIEYQMAWAYLFLNTPGIFFLPFSNQIDKFLKRFFPASQSENDAKPKFIHDQAINDPSTALDLVSLEHHNLIGFYTRYFEILRDEKSSKGGSAKRASNADGLAKRSADLEIEQLHTSFQSVSSLVSELLEDLGGSNSSDIIYDRLNTAMSNTRTINMIETTIYELVITLESVADTSPIKELKDLTTEALDTVLLTLNDVIREGDEYDKKLLAGMTGDRSSALKKIRQLYLESNQHIDGDDQLNLLKITNLSERFFWLLSDLNVDNTDIIRAIDIDLLEETATV